MRSQESDCTDDSSNEFEGGSDYDSDPESPHAKSPLESKVCLY